VETIEKCAAVDGTWGLKKEYHELSLRLAEPLLKGIEAARPDRIATDCPLAALQINQGRGQGGGRAEHPIRILADAYGLTIE
jgi:Fe-S oxidoreductase